MGKGLTPMNYTYYRRYHTPRERRGGFRSFFWLVLGLVFVLLVLRACVSIAQTFFEEKKDEALLTLFAGEAEILEWGQSEYKPVADAQLLLLGDQVRTHEDSELTITFYNGTLIRLDENSELRLNEVSKKEENEEVHVDLLKGRAWVEQPLSDKGEIRLLFKTALLQVQSNRAQYFLENSEIREVVYLAEGNLKVNFMDPSGDNLVIETAVLNPGDMTLLTAERETALLARENIPLVEPVSEDVLNEALNSNSAPGLIEPSDLDYAENSEAESFAVDPGESESTEVGNNTTLETPFTLEIGLLSPASGTTVQKDAIALEGQITIGIAQTVTVTWSGNGTPYTLSAFTPGSSSFRYVADVNYQNFTRGQNTYTIVAYDEQGQPSNTLTVLINAEF